MPAPQPQTPRRSNTLLILLGGLVGLVVIGFVITVGLAWYIGNRSIPNVQSVPGNTIPGSGVFEKEAAVNFEDLVYPDSTETLNLQNSSKKLLELQTDDAESKVSDWYLEALGRPGTKRVVVAGVTTLKSDQSGVVVVIRREGEFTKILLTQDQDER